MGPWPGGSSSRCLSLSLWVSQTRRAACPGLHCPHPAQVALPGSQELGCLTGTPVLTWRPCACLTGRCWPVRQCLHRPHPSRGLPAALYLYRFLLTCACRAPGPGVRVKSPLLVHLRCSSVTSCLDTALSGTAGLLARALSPWPLMPLSVRGSRSGPSTCCARPRWCRALGKEPPTFPFDTSWAVWELHGSQLLHLDIRSSSGKAPGAPRECGLSQQL